VDPNKERREAVKRKITQYLRRAEEIFNCHLQRAGAGNTTATGYSSLRFRPIRTLSSAVENLRRCKVVGVIDKVQIVQDPATGETFILKSLPKSHVETRERQTIIPHGVPFMVKLLCYYVSEDSIFLHLEHVQEDCAEWGRGLLKEEGMRLQCARSWQWCGTGHGVLVGLGDTFCLITCSPFCFPGETLWSHLRSKYCVQQDSADSNTIHSLRDHGTEDGVGNSHQGLVVYPWSDLTSGTSCKSERTASQKEPRFPQGLVPVLKTVRGGQPGAGRLLTQKVDLASHGHNRRAWAVKEEQVQLWAAEILLALEGLHQQGVLCRDLNPRNLLLDAAGHIRLTFFGQWTEVEPQYCSQAQEELYSAPEVGGIMEPTEAADCWSFGSLLYELLTGVPLSQNHPSGIQPHTQLHLPEGLSLAATSLLTELLQYNPKQRLGSGGAGITKLKSHSFFSTVPWNKLVG
ncbi:RPKL1 protein, partial [Dasyornis broadbenti]|nr:RPKL1 protein [Dasyornis broadbenti]